jgi:hypothetical protein
VRAWIPPVLFLAAFVCFVGILVLATRLGSERIGPAPTRRQFWTGWIPGEFTPHGQQLRRRINGLGLVGALLLACAILL